MVVAPWEGSICSARNNHNLQQGSALNLEILCQCFSLIRDFLNLNEGQVVEYVLATVGLKAGMDVIDL